MVAQTRPTVGQRAREISMDSASGHEGCPREGPCPQQSISRRTSYTREEGWRKIFWHKSAQGLMSIGFVGEGMVDERAVTRCQSR